MLSNVFSANWRECAWAASTPVLLWVMGDIFDEAGAMARNCLCVTSKSQPEQASLVKLSVVGLII